MEFLILFLPAALWINAAGIHSWRVDRRLIRWVQARRPQVLDEVRGRPRRWYDAPDALTYQHAGPMRALRSRLASAPPLDPELAELLRLSERAYASLRMACIAGGVFCVVVLVLARLHLG